ncbi:MAG: hypothetical protein PHU42_00885 [Patescibacteria group bacterium]|nr:hypothetical protein [Patescibacteria group bacterium]
MKKIIVVLAVILFGLSFCLNASAVVPNKDKVVGKPANPKLIVKMDKSKAGGNIVVFSEDGGKTFYPIFDGDGVCDQNVFVWSPDGKYVFWISSDMSCEAPFLKDGVWHHYARLYDPAKRILFLWPSLPSAPNYHHTLGVNWAKGSGHDILMRTADKGQNSGETIEATVDEWEKNSSRVDMDPYLQWLASWITSVVKKNQLDALYSLTKNLPPKEVDSIAIMKKEYSPKNLKRIFVREFDSDEEGARGVEVRVNTFSNNASYFFEIGVVVKNKFPLPPEIISFRIGMEGGD